MYPTKKKAISYGHQWIDEEDTRAVSEALNSFYLTTGPVANTFEEDLCRLTGARNAIVCSNGTAALHLACLGLGIKENDLGITSPITFLSSANCIEFCRGKVDFVDIDLKTLCLSPELLADYCRNITIPRVVVTVDFAGIASNMVAIKRLSEKYGFKIIEDAAHSIGTTYTHENVAYQCGGCAHSDVAVFSFHPVKTITCGEGGAVLTNDDKLANKIRNMRSHGVQRNLDLLENQEGPWYYEMRELGYNSRITDFQCALGRSQLKKLAFFKRRRREIVSKYNEAFHGFEELVLPPDPAEQDVCYHLYPIQFTGGSTVRRDIYQRLRKEKIFSQIHYIPVYRQPYYRKKYHYLNGKCPQAELYYSRCLSLPLYPGLRDEQVDFIINCVKINLQAILNSVS